MTDAIYSASVIFRHAGHLVGCLMTRPEVAQPPLQAMTKGASKKPLHWMVNTGRAMWPRQVERRTTRVCRQAKKWVWVRHMVGRGMLCCAVASVVVDLACPWQPIEVGKKKPFWWVSGFMDYWWLYKCAYKVEN